MATSVARFFVRAGTFSLVGRRQIGGIHSRYRTEGRLATLEADGDESPEIRSLSDTKAAPCTCHPIAGAPVASESVRWLCTTGTHARRRRTIRQVFGTCSNSIVTSHAFTGNGVLAMDGESLRACGAGRRQNDRCYQPRNSSPASVLVNASKCCAISAIFRRTGLSGISNSGLYRIESTPDDSRRNGRRDPSGSVISVWPGGTDMDTTLPSGAVAVNGAVPNDSAASDSTKAIHSCFRMASPVSLYSRSIDLVTIREMPI